jgi:ABC-type polysaccharide/polyol phosphate export permease
VFRVKEEGYFPFVLSGLFAWNFLSATINNSTASLVNNFHFLRSVRVSPSYFPISVVGSEAIHFMISSILMVLVLIAVGIVDSSPLWLLSYFVLSVVTLIFLCSLGVILGIFCVFVRDIQYLVAILLQMTFFLAPVVYPVTLVPADLQSIYIINPFAQYVELWRSVLLEGTFSAGLFLRFFGLTLVIFGLAVLVFRRYRTDVADYA